MAYNFLACDRDQAFLLPPDVRDWLPEGQIAWFVLDVVDQLDLHRFLAAHRADGHGRAAYEPRMLLGVLLYAYCLGVRLGFPPSSGHLISGNSGLPVCGDLLVVDGAVVVERGVPAAVVVERDPGEHRQAGLLGAVEVAAQLALESREEALGHGVVVAVPDRAHRLDELVGGTDRGERR
jgi:hypothetical protein